MKIRLKYIHYMPKDLVPGVLYVSKEFETAAHLCVCGCGAKVRTPLGPTEWAFKESAHGPSLNPSIGNWQQKCKSHYWISDGEIQWAEEWTQNMIDRGRRNEESRRNRYYENLEKRGNGLFRKFVDWVKGFWRT